MHIYKVCSTFLNYLESRSECLNTDPKDRSLVQMRVRLAKKEEEGIRMVEMLVILDFKYL